MSFNIGKPEVIALICIFGLFFMASADTIANTGVVSKIAKKTALTISNVTQRANYSGGYATKCNKRHHHKIKSHKRH